MAQHAATQPQVDSEQVVKDAATALKTGTPLTDQELFFAAGHAVKLAVDEQDTDFQRFVVLAQAGEYTTAAALLVEMAMSSNSNQGAATSNDPLAHLINPTPPPAPQQPAPATATPPPASGNGPADPTATAQQPPVDPSAAQSAPSAPAQPAGSTPRRHRNR